MKGLNITLGKEETAQEKHERHLRQIGPGYNNPFDSPEHEAQLMAAFENVPDHLKMAKLLEINALDELNQVTPKLPYEPDQRQQGIKTPKNRYQYDEDSL